MVESDFYRSQSIFDDPPDNSQSLEELERRENAHTTLTDVVDHLLYEITEKGIPKTIRENRRFYFPGPIRPKDLEALTVLPLEILLIKPGEDFFINVGNERSVKVPSINSHNSPFLLHVHVGDKPDVSPEDVETTRQNKRISLVVSRYGISIITPDAAPAPLLLGLQDHIDMLRGQRYKVAERDKADGVIFGTVSFQEKEKIQLICDFINGVRTWKDIEAQVKD